MSPLSHGERVLFGRLGAYTMLSEHDPREVTRAARAAFISKFERDVDPNGVLPLEERLRRAEMARKAHTRAWRSRSPRRAASVEGDGARHGS